MTTETLLTLELSKDKSPFTQYFSQHVDDEQRDNSSYLPDSFNMIREVIHLYPLWSAALQCEISRLATSADD